ncbi:uncharacterized protein [Cardiocondyla obscurior]|uniref:uncharacterized protein isoform X2 n=1 Tax=Cardiocondyla obscurior TaxID=286306 RepID=UPI003965782E
MSKEDDERKLQDASTADAAAKDPNADIYENRGTKKIIRVVTVMAYLFSMQFLIAPTLEKVDPTTEDSFLLQTEVNRAHKPLLSRTMHDDGDSVLDRREKTNLEKKNHRLNMVLLKLRHSLVDNLRARNLSRATTAPSKFDNSLVRVTTVRNSTIISQRGEAQGNILEEKTHGLNLSSELAGSNASEAESTSSTRFVTILETETSRAHLDKNSNIRLNPIIEEKNLKNGLSNVTTNSGARNGDSRRSFGNYSFKKKIQEILKIDRKEPVRRSKTNDDRFIQDDRKSDLNNVQTIVLSKAGVNDSVENPQENNSNEPSSKDRMEQITHDTTSTGQSRLEFIDDPGFRQMHDSLVTAKSWSHVAKTGDFKETQIERMTARSATIDNKQLEQIDVSTTQQQKSFSEVFTEIADVEETSVDLTSISTTRDYHNFTGIMNEDHENVT